ncbi:type II toxin-antitoxin system PemK/MazF family toxin [Candidatus Woesearchaeota archaeon]|nr:type II toxin-antitoxin system PemK/MazF family toxin [Candidatus Woesearchaeota archaeon]
MYKPGDVILASVHFTDTFEIKKRPAVILFEEFDNFVVAGITSNINMNGIKLLKKEGVIKDSIIKLNYIFTISKLMIEKTLFHLNSSKKQEIFKELNKKLSALNN